MSSRTEETLKKPMLTAFFLRMLGALTYSMLVQYYYGYGDSFTFYEGGKFIAEQVSSDFSNIRYLFAPMKEVGDWFDSVNGDTSMSGYFSHASGNMVMKISALISFVAFNKFLIISMFFGYFSFLGQWKLFTVFDDLNKKQNRKLLAAAVLYTPSIWFWGSGLLKDTICMGALGYIIFYLYKFIVWKKFNLKDLFLLIFFFYILTVIKSYITVIFLIGLAIMAFSKFLVTIKNILFRAVVLFITLGLTGLMIYSSDFSGTLNDMAEESVQQIQNFQHNYQLLQETEENSKAGFGLGELEPSFSSLILKSPAVIFTTLFRPFIWESRKIIILFTSLESLLLLMVTLYVMFKMGIITFFRVISRTPTLLFCFSVSMLFALIIGFTTFNFGTMIRYKIVLLPFYYFMLTNLYTLYIGRKKPAPQARVIQASTV